MGYEIPCASTLSMLCVANAANTFLRAMTYPADVTNEWQRYVDGRTYPKLSRTVQQVTFTAKSVTIDEAGNTVLSLTN